MTKNKDMLDLEQWGESVAIRLHNLRKAKEYSLEEVELMTKENPTIFADGALVPAKNEEMLFYLGGKWHLSKGYSDPSYEGKLFPTLYNKE